MPSAAADCEPDPTSQGSGLTEEERAQIPALEAQPKASRARPDAEDVPQTVEEPSLK